MALIYRRSTREIVRKAPASQMQAGRCNNCLIRSGKFGISMAVQKSLIPRVQFWVTSKVAHAARQGQVQAGPGAGPGQGQGQGGARAQGDGQGPVRCSCRAVVPALPCWHRLWGPVPRGLVLAVPPWYGPVPWGPWHGEGHTLRWIDLPRCRPAEPGLSLLGRALLGRAANRRAASGRTGPGVSRSGSESNGADGPGFCSLIPLF